MDDRFGLETALRLVDFELSEASKHHLTHYVELLRVWQRSKNLVSNTTLNEVWTRHVADGLQLVPFIQALAQRHQAKDTFNIIDLGSGAGLPGLIVAMAMADRQIIGLRPHITLVEANSRKSSFLRTVSRETEVSVTVINERIETVTCDPKISPDIITARALAPLDKLVALARPWMEAGATGFFHKGGEYARELDEWTDGDAYNVVDHVSVVDPKSRILQITKKDVQRPKLAP